MFVALTIAGSDPSGGAGLQADLKTFHQHGVFGTSVVTLLTVQNTRDVSEVRGVDSHFVARQLRAVLEDLRPAAVKTGALGSPETVQVVAELVAETGLRLVVDPVMISTHGARLTNEDAHRAVTDRLLPHALLVTPNLAEAATLCGFPVASPADMAAAARVIADFGAANVLVKGGHLAGQPLDILLSGNGLQHLEGERIKTHHTHGTGCVYSAAITARLARGESLLDAVQGAKRFVTEAIRTNPGLGSGQGPTNMFVDGDSDS